MEETNYICVFKWSVLNIHAVMWVWRCHLFSIINDTLTETKGDRPACLGPFVVTIVIYSIYTSRYEGAFCFASILIFLIVN